MTNKYGNLPYNPEELSRELKRHYISASEADIDAMLKELGIKKLEDLYSHIPADVRFDKAPEVTEELEYEALVKHVEELSKKNNLKTSFIGDGLKNYKQHDMATFVANIRGLTTAYTPYQPERSQGTLSTLWMYSSTLSMLTGYEAINASMYDRSTCLFEALNTTLKLVRKTNTVIVCESIYPGDIEVLNTLQQEYPINIVTVPVNKITGKTDVTEVRKVAEQYTGKLASIAFPQINSLGSFEDVHELTDLCTELKIKSIAIFDPMLIATKGLIPPSQYGSEQQGADIIVGEGQHLALSPNYGGPGLGIFGIRYNQKNKVAIRSTPGRFVGKGKDESGNDALTLVLSTREQHIRREKATSNICSNQSYIATMAGAAILGRGEKGMTESCLAGREMAVKAVSELLKFNGVELAFPNTSFYNEFTLALPKSAKEAITNASKAGLHIGVDVSERTGSNNHLLVSFFDIHTDIDIAKLVGFFKSEFGNQTDKEVTLPEVPTHQLRKDEVGLPNFSTEELKDFYTKLGDQNVSPDDIIYPLGSCTMKYNPYINDYAAGLEGFAEVHPQAPEEDVQASLEILYQTQELFKSITGLPGVVTQAVAGAQGEYCGIKMFQAYHRDRGEGETRNVILIPHSAHGTNPATASMAGFETKVIDGVKYGIVLVEADESGQINIEKFKALVEEYNTRICGVMITNPNTSGIFETKFKEIADLVHGVGGLVYMDGANMNAIAGWIDLDKMGVDAIHNNIHKTWSISHGGGGPGDAMVGVSSKLLDFIPGVQVRKEGDKYVTFKPEKSIGSLHRHLGNFAHKIRCYTYLKALGTEGVRRMSSVAVLSARYLYKKLKQTYPTLPLGANDVERMHEFILTITDESFAKIAEAGTPKANAVAKIGKLFLDFGLHAPTVAFPEIYGLMVEPTESYTKAELDRFADVVNAIQEMLKETPEVLVTAPHFMPIDKVDEVGANKTLVLNEKITSLPKVRDNRKDIHELGKMPVSEICTEILKAHKARL